MLEVSGTVSSKQYQLIICTYIYIFTFLILPHILMNIFFIRCGIAPFDEAREVLSEIKPFSKWYESTLSPKTAAGVKCEPDILDLCHILPKEVINLEGKGKGYNVDLDADEDDYKAFKVCLFCTFCIILKVYFEFIVFFMKTF